MKKYYSRLQEIAGIKNANLLTEETLSDIETVSDAVSYIQDTIETMLDEMNGMEWDETIEISTDYANHGGSDIPFGIASLEDPRDFGNQLKKAFLNKEFIADTTSAIKILGYTDIDKFVDVCVEYFEEVLSESDVTGDRESTSVDFNWKVKHDLKK
jgi:hypothetical protein